MSRPDRYFAIIDWGETDILLPIGLDFMTKNKKTPLVLAVVVATLLIAGGAATYWFLSQKRQQEVILEMPVGVEVVPQDVLMSISMSTDEEQWHQMRQFGTPETQAAFDQRLAELRDRLLTANGYDYSKDIQPWVGPEVTVAFLSPNQLSSNSSRIGMATEKNSLVLVVPVAKPLLAKQLLDQQGFQADWVERTYKGIEIKESKKTASEQEQYSTAVLSTSYLVVTNNPQATNLLIDTYQQGNPSLASTPGYREANGQIQNPAPFARIYVNLPKAAAIASANAAQPIPKEKLAEVQQNQGLAATAIVMPNGILFKGISWLHPESEKRHVVENNAQIMPQLLPADTMLAISGGNLARLWQEYTREAEANPIEIIDAEWVRRALAQTTGLDLEADLLNWMESEFSIAMIPAISDTDSTVPFALSLMVQATDRRAATKTLKELDEIMQEKYKFQVEEGQITDKSGADRDVITWTPNFGLLDITRGWLDDNIAFLTVGAPVAEAIIPRSQTEADSSQQPSLATSELFRETVPLELQPNNGHFFIDVDRVFDPNILSFLIVPPKQQAMLNAIRSLGVTAAVTSSRTIRYDIFVGLKQGNSPGVLPSPPPTPSP
ncbi:MAG: DUF3352 domain-containing protein [Hormoscilla sp.]